MVSEQDHWWLFNGTRRLHRAKTPSSLLVTWGMGRRGPISWHSMWLRPPTWSRS